MMPRIGLDLPTLVRAAAELADAQGLEAVTLASVAQKLQIRSPSLYNHVNGLADLRRQLALKGIELLTGEIDASASGTAGDERIRAIAESYVSFARLHPGLYEALQRAPEPGDEELARAGGDLVGRFVEAMKDYDIEADEALHAVRVVRSMLHGFVTLERQGAFGLPLELDVTFRLLVDTFLKGIRSPR
ncbi:TetR-like C-terminal domain-containing protein [Cohnella algarum]|uniref:TetR-like C-terminal domain-containing protein n=1 Tax=Cohnella algarum TaxID=2044859 RepID=UPI0019687117|nr:TetR-like C-terminal domain-containing protein [Cohnella algarum]MBN2980330.1 WHG domain-containing protein [Cohnella algarum]